LGVHRGDEAAAAVAGLDVAIKKTVGYKGDHLTSIGVARVRSWDKLRALEILAKYFGLLKERIEHSGSVATADPARMALLTDEELATAASIVRKITGTPDA
jgi:hypothetical protein